MIDFRLFGQIDLRDAEGHELTSVLAQPKRLAVLAYLAVNRPRGFQRRDKIIGLFWPDLDQSRARQALNKTVHHLRRFLGAEVIASRGDEELALAPELIQCDVWALEDAIASGDRRAALALYRGDFADGLFVVDAPEVEQWLSSERDRLRSLVVAAAASEADTAPSQTDAVHFAERALELAPSDERALRRLMTTLERAGDPAGALRRFDDFARRLDAELGVSPSPEIAALRQRIATPRAAPISSPGPTVAVPTAAVAAVAAVPPSHSAAVPSTPAPAPRARRNLRASSIAAVATFAIAAVVLAVAVHRRDVAASTNVDGRRVFMLPIENRTGDSSLTLVGQMASDWIVEGLTGADIAEVVAYGGVAPKPTMATARNIARETGARHAIGGAYYKEGDSVHFQLQVIDTRDGAVSRVFRPVSAPIARPDLGLEPLRQQAMTLLSQEASPTFSAMLRGSPPTYAAYREYMEGVELYAHREQLRAYDAFIRSAQLDTSFSEGLLSAAAALEFTGTPMDSVLSVLRRRRETLSSSSRLWLDAIEANKTGNGAEWSRLSGELARLLPTSFYPYRYVNSLVQLNRLHAARDEVRRIDPTTGWMNGWYAYWVTRVMIDHLLADTAAQRADVVAGDRQYPSNIAIATAAAFPIGAAGDRARIDSLLDRSVTLPPQTDWTAGSVFAAAAREAAAHDHEDVVPHIRQRALAWYNALSPREREEETWFGLCWMLYSVEAWPELSSRVDGFLRQAPHDPRWLAYQGLIAAHNGDTTAAKRASLAVEANKPPVGEIYSVRARIAGMLGQRDSALALLRTALGQPTTYGAAPFGSSFNVYLHSDPAFHALRHDREFIQIIAPKE